MRTIFQYEDYLDFSYNGKWASELGLIKVNKGKRQDDTILPSSKDTTIDVPGADGMYFLKSKYQQREFTIDFAYDGLTEKDVRDIREWLSPQKECRLIFSESPYKYYMAKPKSAPKLSYIAFDEKRGEDIIRVYKGEGTVQFVCYYPWARSTHRFLEDLDRELTSEQLAESGLISIKVSEGEAAWDKVANDNTIPYSNGGQMPSPFKFFFKVNPSEEADYTKISGDLGALWLDCKDANWNANKTYLLDSENHLILSVKNVKYDNNILTYDIEKESKGNAIIMNGAIAAGDFFNLSVGEGSLSLDSAGFIIPYVNSADRIDDNGEVIPKFENYFLYDYLYY